jgi:DNA (cytosine-5)-methyltransferase 1
MTLIKQTNDKKNRGHGYFEGSESEIKTPTLNAKSSRDNISVHQGEKIRRLTEIECERLQGFPDNWTQFGNYDGIVKKIPKTHRYKMCGNAVTVKVVELVVRKLF